MLRETPVLAERVNDKSRSIGNTILQKIFPGGFVTIVGANSPTGNLNEDTANEIIDIFTELAHEENKCVIIVAHSKELAQKADVILTLKKCFIVGTEDTVLDEKIKRGIIGF